MNYSWNCVLFNIIAEIFVCVVVCISAGPIFGDLSDVTQMTDVHQFMLDHQHNGGVIPLLMAYLTKLAHKATEKW